VSATFASLAFANYRLYLSGQLVSNAGNWMQKLGQSWLVLELTDSGTLLGVTLAFQQLPILLLAPWAGVVADRYPKRRLLLWTGVAGVVPSSVLAALLWTGHIHLWIVMVLAAANGVIDSMGKPTRQAIAGDLVPPQHLANAVTLNNVAVDSGRAIGPAIAGVLIATVGLPFTFLVNALSFVPVVAAALLMDPAEMYEHKVVTRARGQMREGLRYVRSTPQLFGPLLLLGMAGLLAYNFQVLLPLLAKQTFHGDARTVGFVLTAHGAGAVVGGLALAGVLRPTVNRMIVAALVLAGLIVCIGLSPTLPVAIGVVAIVGASSVVYRVLTSTWLQLTADPQMRGRVLALLVMALGGTTPLGSPMIGWIASHFGVRFALGFAGTGTALVAVGVAVYMSRVAARARTELVVLTPSEPTVEAG